MQTAYENVRHMLKNQPRTWLVTGAAGFIGSHLVETLLSLSQKVVGLDNFMTGHRANLEAAARVNPTLFTFIEGDIRDAAVCAKAVQGVDIVLHQAALGSVPRSIDDPLLAHEVNVDGFMHMLLAAKQAKVSRFVYASSSACYGDSTAIPTTEGGEGKQLSPYAATKTINDVYAQTFATSYGMQTVGLRYFNIFGPRQDPHGPYAAVIPLWMDAMANGKPCHINGDGETTRDFCHVANAVQANILAGITPDLPAGEVFNIAIGGRTTLNELFYAIRDAMVIHQPAIAGSKPDYRAFREGDVRHSLADTGKAARLLGYKPDYGLADGIRDTVRWYAANKS